MKMDDIMPTGQLRVQIVDGIEEATHYGSEIPLLVFKKAIIVGNGSEFGLPTIDLQMMDLNGKEYVLMTTGRIIEMLASAIRAKREKDASKS